jgi:hypothetical protein
MRQCCRFFPPHGVVLVNSCMVRREILNQVELRLQSGLNLILSNGFGVTPRSGYHATSLAFFTGQ